MQKRWPSSLAPVLVLAAVAFATPAAGSSSGAPTKFGPYDVATDDHGSCGNVWAVDAAKRTFTVQPNGDGTYALIRHDRGTFVTKAGRSPGACQKSRPHGRRVPASKHGTFSGVLRGRISGGTFDPNATCPADCGFTDVWIATFFGPDATFSCFQNSRACTFDYEYSALKQRLRLHHWSDKGTGAGTLLSERFRGDIAR
jgi:hypothetical protein